MSEAYDAAKDSHDSYYAAIEAKRLRVSRPDMFIEAARSPEPLQEAML